MIFYYVYFFEIVIDKLLWTTWTKSMGFCKENGTYLAGNLNLSTATSACTGYNYTSPRWIGAFRENYFNTDQGI